ncbi:hypothetical protein H4219_002259 [Mycoemilia scoparia]|uniref:Uncharacterized protein n=1 Tax=Mycoemilia scoparia TaxID=417184 RepID=A0A9W8DPC4_9FUNG|nr:hypothetical protein H4219_002259 [Mycoemilia scoparia]
MSNINYPCTGSKRGVSTKPLKISGSPATAKRLLTCTLALLALAEVAYGHEHHAAMSDQEAVKDAKPIPPANWVLFVHIGLMFFAYAILFPLALTLSLARQSSKHIGILWLFTVVSLAGYIFGWVHKNGGNYPRHSAHSNFSWVMLVSLAARSAFGTLYAHKKGIITDTGFNSAKSQRVFHIYNWSCLAHGIFGYMQMIFGVLISWNLCQDRKSLGQCLSHFIRGSGLVFYGCILFLALRLCGPIFKLLQRPIEFYQSLTFFAIGLFTIFTEHNFIDPEPEEEWSHKDFQHTFIGVLWISGGALGAYLGYKAESHGRNIIPAVVLLITGLAMSNHEQDTVISTKVHSVFGWSLILTGVTQIIEILLLGAKIINHDSQVAHSFQYVPPFFMALSGIHLMGATHDQVIMLIYTGVDFATYSMTLASCIFFIFVLLAVLVDIYKKYAPERLILYLNRNRKESYSSTSFSISEGSQEDHTRFNSPVLSHTSDPVPMVDGYQQCPQESSNTETSVPSTSAGSSQPSTNNNKANSIDSVSTNQTV